VEAETEMLMPTQEYIAMKQLSDKQKEASRFSDPLRAEMIEVLREIQSECESSPDGLHEATLGVIAMKARQAIANAGGIRW
jgi:hypothetical protein